MRLHIVSDLHIDVVGGFDLALAAGADVLVVAGDVCEGIANGMAYLRAHVPLPTPILMIAGNHEFYRHGLADERAAAADHARAHAITFLDDSATIIEGVRFLGATLWTDFRLGADAWQALNMGAARDRMNDFRQISLRREPWARFTPEASVRLHTQSRAFLEEALATPFDGPTVVVSHHAPHPMSIAARFVGNPLNAAFASDLTELIERHQPALWIHGHMHDSSDYRLGATRIVCNPRGYGDENPRFDPGLIIEL